MVRVKPARSRNFASLTRPLMTSLKFLLLRHPPRTEVNLLLFLTFGNSVERTSISRQHHTTGRFFTSVSFWNRDTEMNHRWANSRWRIAPTSVGTRVQRLWDTYFGAVAKPPGIPNGLVGLAIRGAIWTRSGFWFWLLVFPLVSFSRSHLSSLAFIYPFRASYSGARKVRSAIIMVEVSSSCLRRGTDSNEVIRSTQT